jgi:hypothetical protein
MNTLTGHLFVFLSMVFLTEGNMNGKDLEEEKRPNILVCLADDASFPHMGEACSWIHTPAFNRIAREGLAFMNAGSPTKTEVLRTRKDPASRHFWELSFGKRTKEELFDLGKDVDCIHNLACEPAFDSIRDEMRRIMVEALEEEADPRMFGKGDQFHSYVFSDERWRNLYQRMVVDQEEIYPMWINKSDIETGLIEPQGF